MSYPGYNNSIADALSWLPLTERQSAVCSQACSNNILRFTTTSTKHQHRCWKHRPLMKVITLLQHCSPWPWLTMIHWIALMISLKWARHICCCQFWPSEAFEWTHEQMCNNVPVAVFARQMQWLVAWRDEIIDSMQCCRDNSMSMVFQETVS